MNCQNDYKDNRQAGMKRKRLSFSQETEGNAFNQSVVSYSVTSHEKQNRDSQKQETNPKFYCSFLHFIYLKNFYPSPQNWNIPDFPKIPYSLHRR